GSGNQIVNDGGPGGGSRGGLIGVGSACVFQPELNCGDAEIITGGALNRYKCGCQFRAGGGRSERNPWRLGVAEKLQVKKDVSEGSIKTINSDLIRRAR